MKQKNNLLLMITGILMIIGGALSCLLAILDFLGISFLAVTGYGNEPHTVIVGIFLLVSAIITLVAGILGVQNAGRPDRAGSCILFGILAIAITLIGTVLGMLQGVQPDVLNLIVGLIIPILYLIGAFQNKSRANANR